jgi:hypothetical protein
MKLKKICTKCNSEKNVSFFYSNKLGKFGVKSICKECEKSNKIEYNKFNKKTRQQSNRKYYLSNKQKFKQKKWSFVSEKVRIGNRLRCRIRMTLKGKNKSKSTWELLGCSFEEFKIYFKKKFTKDMTWNDFIKGDIHIDHIIPCANFDLSKIEDQKKCFYYTNLQPLWRKDNLKKNKY